MMECFIMIFSELSAAIDEASQHPVTPVGDSVLGRAVTTGVTTHYTHQVTNY